MERRPLREISDAFSSKELRAFLRIHHQLSLNLWTVGELREFLVRNGILERIEVPPGDRVDFLKRRRDEIKKLPKETRKAIRKKNLEFTRFGRIRP